VVDRLTDTSKYTGSHRERFDEEGKGRGLSGRYATDVTTQNGISGYVSGYTGKDTYDQKHWKVRQSDETTSMLEEFLRIVPFATFIPKHSKF